MWIGSPIDRTIGHIIGTDESLREKEESVCEMLLINHGLESRSRSL